MRSVRPLIAAAALAAATCGAALPAAAATPRTPLRITAFPLAPDGTFPPGTRLEVDARVRNAGRSTIRGGRLELFLRRRATTDPAGRPDARGHVPGVRGGTPVLARASLTVTRAMHGAYRIVACVRSPGRARACRVVRGTVTVR